ncbi:ArsR/SmtB family transcription factor [Naumannella halotolerans]|uniref:ArsR/SmtB family transcription factor n=1 Tax=Naumannella halotolerans TaxID=993414 RepID=UPI00141522A6|nr:winged helix-turn-helix domain-containing protein [Naumannella halotolerans]
MDLERRLTALESVVADLRRRLHEHVPADGAGSTEANARHPAEDTGGTEANSRSDPAAGAADAEPNDPNISPAPTAGSGDPNTDRHSAAVPWLVGESERDGSPGGTVAYGGEVDLPTGEHYQWEWHRPTTAVLSLGWDQVADRLDALGSPVRLRILQAVLNGTQTTAGLSEVLGLGTGGQLHHHLRSLSAAGWLTSTARGHWTVPGPRVIPLLTTILATGE